MFWVVWQSGSLGSQAVNNSGNAKHLRVSECSSETQFRGTLQDFIAESSQGSLLRQRQWSLSACGNTCHSPVAVLIDPTIRLYRNSV